MRTNLAAVVAEGAVKPTSTYTLVRVEDKLDVVAHLSEAVPRFWIADNVALEQFLTNEMTYGLALAVEALIVSDVAGTNGVQTQAYATSPLVTLRKSLTKLETTGYVPSAIAVNPTDFEAVELALATTTALEHMSLPFDAAARRLWGTPLVATNAVAAGVAYTLAQGAVGLMTDQQGVQVAWSETSNSDDGATRQRCWGADPVGAQPSGPTPREDSTYRVGGAARTHWPHRGQRVADAAAPLALANLDDELGLVGSGPCGERADPLGP